MAGSSAEGLRRFSVETTRTSSLLDRKIGGLRALEDLNTWWRPVEEISEARPIGLKPPFGVGARIDGRKAFRAAKSTSVAGSQRPPGYHATVRIPWLAHAR